LVVVETGEFQAKGLAAATRAEFDCGEAHSRGFPMSDARGQATLARILQGHAIAWHISAWSMCSPKPNALPSCHSFARAETAIRNSGRWRCFARTA
jgi:hypothetical protein